MKNNQHFAIIVSLGDYQSSQTGLTVNQMASAFGGASPSSPTARRRCSSVAEHSLGKGKVVGPILTIGSENNINNKYGDKKEKTNKNCLYSL